MADRDQSDLAARVAAYPPLPFNAIPADCRRWANAHPAATSRVRGDVLDRLMFLSTVDRAVQGGAYEKIKPMAKRIRASVRAVKYSLEYLEKCGAIKIERRYFEGTKARRASLYILPVDYTPPGAKGGAKVVQFGG